MKTKSFLLFSSSVFAICIYLIVLNSQPPQSIQNIVTQTHQHIKDFQENLRDVSASTLVQEERYLRGLGLAGGGVQAWHNTTLPVLVTYAHGDDHALAVGFVRAAAHLPYTVLLYNVGLKPYSLAMIANYCNSSKCAIIELDLSEYPSHVGDVSIHAFRPIVIQHALSRVGGVVFSEVWWRWRDARAVAARWRRALAAPRGAAASPRGAAASPRRAAVTSLTHPRMFHYLHAATDDFLFVQMVDVSRLALAAKPAVIDLMRPWVQCALTLDCIMPIGAQSGGCRFDKKPQYRYSGCHGQDASALSIILGLRSGFEESQYVVRGGGGGGGGGGDDGAEGEGGRRVSAAQAREQLAALLRNSTEAAEATDPVAPL